MENQYFTPEEIEKFKSGSIPFPYFIYEGTDQNNIVEVNEVVALSGMADNSGTPDRIIVVKHVKGEKDKRLVYKLVPEI